MNTGVSSPPARVRAGLLLFAVLATACGDERPAPPEPPTAPEESAVEEVVRLAFEDGELVEVTAAGETRRALVLAAPGMARVCHPAEEKGAPRSLVVGVRSDASGTRVRLESASEAREAEAVAGWTDLRLELGDAAGCLDVAVTGPPDSRVAISAPLLERQGRPRPWVVLYVVDTLRFDFTPWGGSAAAVAPALEAFGRDAVVYRRAFSVTSWTRPSVATLLTGLGPSYHGVFDRQDRLPAGLPRLPERLGEAGWATVAVSTNPNILPLWGFLPGFDRFLDVDAGGWTQREGLARLGPSVATLLEEHAAQPLFLYIHDNGPHAPWAPPAAARDRFRAPAAGHPGEGLGSADDPEDVRRARRRLYQASIRDASDRFGALVSRLQLLGRYEDALIVLVADHGEEFGDHGDVSHGRTLYQEQLHVPLALKLPGGAGRSGVVETAVTTEDVAPTILRLLGLEDGAEPEARTLPLRGGEPGAPAALLFAELDLDGRRAEAVVEWPWKYLRQGSAGERLYDLERDPGETADASGAAPEVLDRLRGASSERRMAARSGLWLDCVAGTRLARVDLTLELAGEVVPVGLEPEDRLGGGPATITASFNLRPAGEFTAGELLDVRLAARGQPDRDRVRLPDPPAAGLRLRSSGDAVRVESPDGAPLATDGSPIALDALGSLAVPAASPVGKQPLCRLYRLEPRQQTVPEDGIDDAVRERLRALGYLEEPSP